jgi:methylphosphotriester-DNA--protein-cysteine methyltransferase
MASSTKLSNKKNGGETLKKAKESEQEQLKNTEFESVTIKVPKNVMNLLRAYSKQGLGMTPDEYLKYCILQAVKADLDTGDVFTVEPEEIIRLYDLNSALCIVA